MRLQNKYTYGLRYGQPEHTWTCIGRRGAVHFHVLDMGERYEKEHGVRYSAGLEIYYRDPPHDTEDAPSHEKCWLIGAPCWHDGTNLYAHERIVPFWLADPNNHERMFRFLENEYAERLLPKCRGDG